MFRPGDREARLSPEKRILVVDDDADIAGMAALVLRRAGYQVTTVNSGDAALVGSGAPFGKASCRAFS